MKIRLYYEQNFEEIDSVLVKEDDFHYLKNVLRCKEDDDVFLFNESGEYLFKIKQVDKKSILLNKIRKTIERENFEFSIGLFYPLVKKETISDIITKSVELGVKNIYPFYSKYCCFKNLKSDKLKLIAKNALQQSAGLTMPQIYLDLPFEKAINLKDGIYFFANEEARVEEENDFYSVLNNIKNISINSQFNIIIGPEGGFSKEELLQMKEKENFIPISLGSRILRTETAVVYSVAFVKNLLNFLSKMNITNSKA